MAPKGVLVKIIRAAHSRKVIPVFNRLREESYFTGQGYSSAMLNELISHADEYGFATEFEEYQAKVAFYPLGTPVGSGWTVSDVTAD